MSRSPELEILGVEDKVSCLDKSVKDLDLLPELESGNPGLTSSKETAREEAEEGPIQLLSDRQLIIFGLAQLVVFAAACAIILQTSFILPVIAKEFNKSDSETQWVAATFMLIWGCFQLIAGRLCDMFGRRRGYLLGCVTHIVFNVMSTFMPNLPSLNVCRGLSGLSSAIMLPASSGLIGSLFPAGRKRTLAYVAITCGGAAGAASGEIVAGAFIRYNRWTWRPCFFTSGLIVLIPLVVGYKLIPIDPPISADWKVDWLGAFSIGSSLFLLLLTLTISQTADNGWKAPYLPALLVISAILFGLFVWRTMQLSTAALRPGNTKAPPIIPRGLLTWEHRNLLVIYIASLFAWAATDSAFVFISYLYFDILKMDPFEAGLKFSVTFFSGSSAGLLVAFTISRVSSRLLLSVCLAISVATSVIFALRETHWAYWQADLWAFLVVIYGTDATIAAGSTIISQTACPEDQSVAAGLFQTSCRLGFAVGLAIATQIRESVERAALSAGRSTDEATLKGLRAAFWTCSAFAATAALIIALGMEGWHKLDKHRSQKEDEEELQIGAREAT